MKFLLRFLYSRRRIIAVILVVAAVFALFMYVYGVPAQALIYAGAVCAAVAAFAAAGDFIRYYNKHKLLEELKNEILFTTENLPAGDNGIEERYSELIELLSDAKAALRSETDMRYENTLMYFTMWVHQIKTPISAMSLALQSSEFPENAELADGLQKIGQYVEMALLYVKLDNEDEDLVFRRCSLDKIVKQAVRRFSAQFIRKRIQLIYEPLEADVLTDEKWLLFVVEQVISNALKYTAGGGSVEISLETPGVPVLLIRDSGMGIAPEDLPRVFERGFTGNNGRADKKATGIGLYLCRRVCGKLGCEISASSSCEPGRSFTEIRIDLSAKAPDVRD